MVNITVTTTGIMVTCTSPYCHRKPTNSAVGETFYLQTDDTAPSVLSHAKSCSHLQFKLY